ncbi:MAG TPA: glutamate-5-semialdehyde dehydrogenase [Mycobacteriales bacterium]|nr:glutamate-5-semialdehyde dehydrogenase [Mycobacteriales bacterium]
MGDIVELATRARAAALATALLTRAQKDTALHAMADALDARFADVLRANADDVERCRADGSSAAMVDRLTLSDARVAAMAAGLRDVAGLSDPVGEVVRGGLLANGLELRQVRVPLGVVGIIYEARPNVTVDAAGLCVKSGNAVLLRGSSSAARSNAVLVEILAEAGTGAGLPADTVQLVPAVDHDSVKQMMRLRGLIDVLIPRGGAGLIRSVVEESTVPVIETGVGNCHLYVDADADLDMALAILVNGKVSRPAVCNSTESLLVHAAVADAFLPRALVALHDAGVVVHGDSTVATHSVDVVPATEGDYAEEYLDLQISAAVVPDLDAAVAHIRRYGSAHTEAIVTRSQETARRFVAAVDSAAVVVNASTRFTDGAEFGYGAEIGISTQKLHARGPMGLAELTSTKYVLTGEGHIR